MKEFDKLTGKSFVLACGACQVEIEIGSYCVFDKSAPSNGLHFHHCYEVSYVIDGRGYFVNNENKVKVSKGSVFLAEPEMRHEIVWKDEKGNKPLQVVYFLFSIHWIGGKVLTNIESDVFHRFNIDHELVGLRRELSMYLDIIRKYEIHSVYDEKMLANIYKQVFTEMVRTLISFDEKYLNISTDSKSLIDVAMVYVRENINRKILVKELAYITGTSERNLQYLFRKHMDTTVIGYIHERKINLACAYLKMNNSVGVVGKMIGIDDVSQFSRLFKKHRGISPKKYQKKFLASGVRYAAMVDKGI